MVREILNSVRWLTSSCSSTQCRYLGAPNSELCTKNCLPSTLNNFMGWFSVPDIFSQLSLGRFWRRCSDSGRKGGYDWSFVPINLIVQKYFCTVTNFKKKNQNVLQVFSALDKDNDGGIGVEEFVTVCFQKSFFLENLLYFHNFGCNRVLYSSVFRDV